MKKKFVSSFFILISLMISGCSQTPTAGGQNNESKQEINNSVTDAKVSADKLEVYYFHRTARCKTCMAIGEYTAKTMMESFSEEVGNGKIDYREINIDLPENKEVAQKFQASGSSLFINQIKDGQDKIEQDTKVWSLAGDEFKFKAYLSEKINSYLGK